MSNYKKSSSLVTVIGKMTKSEKRYFKIHSQQHTVGKVNGYIILFDLIVDLIKQGKTLSEKEIKASFIKRSGVKRYDLYKQHLYKKVLAALVDYHTASSLDIQIKEYISQANILHHKGLLDLALRSVEKATEMCLKHEKWYMLLECLELERHITYALQNPKLDNNREIEVINKLAELGQLRSLQSQLWKTYMTHGLPTNNEILSMYDSLSQNETLSDSIQTKSFEAKIVKLYCRQFLSGMQGNIKKTYEEGKTLVDLMDQHPEYLQEKGQLYIRSLINLQYPMVRLNKKEELIEVGKKLRAKLEVFELSPYFKSSINISTWINQYDVEFKCNPDNERGWIIEELHQAAKDHPKHVTGPTLYLYHWQCALHSFTELRYDEAWHWVNMIEDSPANYRQDIQAFARIMHLIIHYEQGNIQLLQYSIINTYRFLRKKKRLDTLENLLLNMIKKVSKMTLNASGQNTLFEGLIEDIRIIKRNEQSHEALVILYFEHYIRQKTKGQN